MPEPPVAIPGLAALRRDLRAIGKDAQKEFRQAEAEAAKVIAEDAARRAPRGTQPLPPNRKQRLGDTIRPIPAGNKFYVGTTAAKAPHANVVHWGGTIKPKGVPIHFARRPFVLQAFDANRDKFIELLVEQFNNLARRNGWR